MEYVVRSLDEVPAFGVDTVILTGGEPLAFLDEITQIARLAQERGLGIQICSNGFWAKTPEKALAVLLPLKELGLSLLMLSTDRFHTRFIPVESVTNAANAASYLGLSCQIAVPALARDWKAMSLMTRLRRETDATVFSHPIHPVGRGEKLSPWWLSPSSPSGGGCELLGHIEVDYDGSVSACPTSADFSTHNQLILGNIATKSLKAILSRFQNTLIYWVISSYGPVGLRALFRLYGIDTGACVNGQYFQCHICRALTDNAGLYKEFRKITGMDLVATVDDKELSACQARINQTMTH
jgi:hypothetical protein